MLVTVAQEASVLGLKMAQKYEAELVETLQKNHGVTVTRPNKDAFRNALKPMQAKLVSELGLEDALATLN